LINFRLASEIDFSVVRHQNWRDCGPDHSEVSGSE